MPEPPVLGTHVEALLREEHPDPFVQAAIWRLFTDHPEALQDDLAGRLGHATKTDADAITHQEGPL